MDSVYIRVAESIRARIPHLRARGARKLPSEAALAREYGVSRTTVRRALGVLARGGAITTNRGSAARIVERPGGASNVIYVIAGDAGEYAARTFTDIAKSAIEARGLKADIAYAGGARAERDALERALGGEYLGVLAQGVATALINPNADLYARLSAKGVPVVIAGGSTNIQAARVSADDYAGAYALTKHMLDRGRKCLAGAFQADETSGVERLSGFMCALRDADIMPPDERLVLFTRRERATLFEPAAGALWRRALEGATGVVCQDDEIAVSLINALIKSGVSVPGEMAVAGFDDSYLCDECAPKLTSLKAYPASIAQSACDTLFDILSGKRPSPARLEWRLCERESVSTRAAQ